MTETLRAGIVGCGGMSSRHAAAIQATHGVALEALADIDPAALARAGERFKVAARYGDFQAMYDDGGLDLVVVATQAPVHARAVTAAAEAGVKGILCEKPLAMDLAEADAMLQACQAAGTVLAVNHQQQLDPHVQEARRLLASGAIGTLQHLHIYDKGGRPAGNSLMEMAVHLFNLARFLVGAPQWVSAHLTVAGRPAAQADIKHSQEANPGDRNCGLVLGKRAYACFGFSDGLVATFESLARASGDADFCGLDLLGSRGRMVLRGALPPKLYAFRGTGWMPDTPMERVMLEDESQVVAQGIARMMAALVEAVRQGQAHPVSGDAGRVTLEMVMGIYASHRRGGERVALPLAERAHPLVAWRQPT